jgi:MFS family permease
LSSGLAYYALMFLDSPLSIGIGLFVATLLADTFRPANMASVALLAGPETRVKAVGVTRLAFNLGFTAGPALGGLIAANAGYNWIFIIDGSTCILAGLAFLSVFYPHIQAEGKRKTVEMAEGEEKPHLRQVLRDKPFMFFMLLAFVYGVIFMQYFNTVPVYFKNKMMLTEDYIGILMAMNGFLIVLIEMPMLQILEKRSPLKNMALGAIMVGLAYIIFLPGNWIALAWISTLMFTIGEIYSLPFATTVVMNRSTERLRGRYMALYGMTFSLCHIVAPFGMFIADTFGFSILWMLLGLLMLLTAWGYYSLRDSLHDNRS